MRLLARNRGDLVRQPGAVAELQQFAPEAVAGPDLVPGQLVLGEESDDKISQRRMQQKLKNYRVRPLSYEREEIGGQRALAWVADFIQGKINMVEYEVIVQGHLTLAEFTIRCPASELDAASKDVQPVIESVRMP